MNRVPIIDSTSAARAPQKLFGRHASSVVLVTGIVFFLGTSIDFLTLWVFQRGSGLQWEFVAATQTAEGIPRLILGLGLVYLALHLRSSDSVALYRILGASLLFLGLCAGAVLLLIVTNYFTMIGSVDPAAIGAFRTTSLKSAILSLLYITTLIPLGALGLRVPS